MSRPGLVIHYHLFKNAGTSVDEALAQAFPGGWTQFDPRPEESLSPQELADFAEANPQFLAISSHTAMVDLPAIDRNVVPLILLRHPLDRVRSIYDFERLQNAETLGAQRARTSGIAEYVRWRVNRPGDHSITNFQTHRLSAAGSGGEPFSRALDALYRLPFVGLVEHFEPSLARFERLVRQLFPAASLEVHTANVTAHIDSLADRVNELRERLGREAFEELAAANQDDLLLWHEAHRRAGFVAPADR